MARQGLFLRFCREESGQSLAFGVLTFFTLVVMVLMITGISDVTSTQIEMQNAADSAAYSAAEVKADCIAQIAWMNEAMASVWYDAQRLCAETAVTAVHARLKTRPALYAHDQFADLFGGTPYPVDAVVGIENAPDLYNRTWTSARDNVPVAYAWLQRLSRIQRGIAVLAPLLTEQQVFHTARENGSELSCMFRSFLFTPMGPSLCWMDIERYRESDTTKGWRMNGQGLGGTMFFEALHTAPDRASAQPSSRTDGVTLPDGDTHDLVRYADRPDRWDITLDRNSDRVTIRIDSDYAVEGDTGVTIFPPPAEAYAMHDITMTRNGESDQWWVYDYGDGNVAILHGEEDETRITRVHDTPPYFRIEDNGIIYFIRPQPYGYDYTRDMDNDGNPINWQVIDRTGDESEQTTTIDGVDIPISFTGDGNPYRIELGNGLYVDLGPPHRLEWAGVMSATLSTPMRFAIVPISPFWRVTATDLEATVHGLSTRRDADGQWRRVANSDYWNDTDRIRHRMLLVEPEDMDPESPNYWSGQWRYEWLREGSDMRDMSMLRLSCRGIMMYDPQFEANGGNRTADLPLLEAMYGDSGVWHQSGPSGNSFWNAFPRWARPPRDPALMTAEMEDFGGWFNVGHTGSAPAGRPVSTTAYSQTRECWFCGRNNDGLQSARQRASGGHNTLRDIDETSTTHDRMCLRPAGFWHETHTGVDFQTTANARRATINAAWAAAGFAGEGAIRGAENVATMEATIQVACPVCARKAMLARDHFARGEPVLDANDAATLADSASIVRVYLAETIGNHDIPQPEDPFVRSLRVYPDPGIGLTATGRYDYYGVMPAAYSDTRPHLVWLPPLELTAEIFRYGVTVAVWKDAREGVLASLGDGNRAVGMVNPLGYPRWGYFSLATARPVFWNHVHAGTPDRTTAVPALSFAWDGTRPPYIDETDSAIDPLGREINWNREIFLRSPLNLFDPDWSGALVSNRDAVDLRDVVFEDDESNDHIVDDSNVGYLIRMIRAADWRRNAADGRRLRVPNLNATGIDYGDRRMDDIMRH